MKKLIRNIIFLLIAILGIVSCKGAKNNNSGENPEESGDVTIYITTNTRSQDFRKQYCNFSENQNLAPTTIKVVPSIRYQKIDGFGASITGSTCYNLMQMKAENRNQFLSETFSATKGMGYSYIRVSIGCSDFSLSEYSCCDTPGIENFALTDEENNYIIPILKEILEINPKVKIMGSPWTCPPWMKVNNLTALQPFNSWTSGHLNPSFYADYATYFVKWIQAFEAHGIKIYSVTPQNEPLNRDNSASLFMGWQEQHQFVENHLVPKFKKSSINTKIYLFDHNYNYDNMADQYRYPVKIYDKGIDSELVAGAAYHNYGGDHLELSEVHKLYPNRELIFNETSLGTWNDGRNFTVRLMEDMREIGLETVNNWCCGVIVWNLMLDSERGPNRDGGCQTCYGTVDIDKSDYSTITRNSHYYVIGHLSAVVKPGAIRIGTSGFSQEGIIYAAFENPDNTYALVLLNNNDDNRKITIEDEARHFSYDVPSKSVISYIWNK